MEESTLSILLLWIFILVYVIAGALDFGAGFWAMIYSKEEKSNASLIANKYLSPSWEVTNVFLVMFVVALISFFPKATFVFGTVLFVPASLILILLSIRTAFLVFGDVVHEYRHTLTMISGITGLLVPALLVVVLPVTHGGYIEEVDGRLTLPLGNVFSSPTVYAFIFLAIVTTLYLSALFLADYSHFAGDKSAFHIYLKQAKWLGPVSILTGIAVLFTIRLETDWLYENLQPMLLYFGLSVLAFIIAYVLLIRADNNPGNIHIALVATVVQYIIAGSIYGSAHLPYLIYPITVEESFTNLSMYRTLIYSYLIGTALLVPVLIYHWRLFVRDRKYVTQE